MHTGVLFLARVALVLVVALALGPLPVQAERVVASGDSGASGELRTVVESVSRSGAVVNFAPGVNPSLAGRAVLVRASDLLLQGRSGAGGVFGAGSGPGTSIFRSGSPDEAVFSFSGGEGNGLRLLNLAFVDIRRDAGSVPVLGGGIVSAANGAGSAGAHIAHVRDTAFTGIRVSLHSRLDGAGLLGAANTQGAARIGGISRGVFQGNTVRLTNASDAETGRIWGAGLVGAFAQKGTASLGDVQAVFWDNTVSTATYINGAGLVGSFVPVNRQDALLGKLSGSFARNRVIVGTNLSGGGLVGAWSWAGNVGAGDVSADFIDNTVDSRTSYMRGGGMVGLRTYRGTATLGTVSGNFTGNRIRVGDSLGGGGIIGLYSAATSGSRKLDRSSTFAGLAGASFVGNTVQVGRASTVNAYALGGVIAVTGLNEQMLVSNTRFLDNSLTITGAGIHDVGGGAIYIGTDRQSANPQGHVVTLTAKAGKATEFKNNSITLITKGKASRRTNSITFSREWDSASDSLLSSLADAVLNIAPATKGRVALFDPLRADMDNGKSLTVNLSGGPGSQTLWGGKNELDAEGGASVAFVSGNTELAPDFQLASRTGKNLAVSFGFAHALRVNLTGRLAELPYFAKPVSFTASGSGAGTVAGVYYGLDSTAKKEWLITNARGAMDENSFTLADGPLFTTSLRTRGQSLFMRLDNSRAVSPIAASASINTRRAYAAGALPEAWNAALSDLDLEYQAPALLWARENAPALTAEGLLSQGLVSLRSTRNIRAQSLLQAGQMSSGGVSLTDAPAGERGEEGEGRLAASRLFRTWLGYIGSDGRQRSHAGRGGYNAHFKGLSGGVGLSLLPRLEAGLYVAYADAHTSYKRLGTSVDTDILQAGVFTRFQALEKAHILLDAYYAHMKNDSSRATFFDDENAHFTQNILGVGSSVEREIALGSHSRLTPRAGVEYQRLRQPGVREKGSALAQHINRADADSWRASLGLSLAHAFVFLERLELTPVLHAGYSHEFGDSRLSTATRYAGSPRSMRLTSLQQDRNYGEAGLQMQGRILTGPVAGLGFSGSYSVEFSRKYTQQTFQAGLQWSF
ncbi:autotransporter outer membrane beta-barrel domain-containing protein [Desulfovibrio sp. OttesenSCG-928-G15]|nr:autotransporter outer membrane beta-barrel domain-containing protein [Desulfovibrio sp. OttesenSCG-928-G15]